MLYRMGARGTVRLQFGGQHVDITVPLPLYETTDVKIRAIYSNIEVFYNGTLVKNTTILGWRASGLGVLFVADPIITPTTANMGPVSFTSLYAHELQPNLMNQKVPTVLEIPKNYDLTFTITPFRIAMNDESILRFSASNYDNNTQTTSIWYALLSASFIFIGWALEGSFVYIIKEVKM